MNIVHYLLRKILWGVPVFIAASIFVFSILHIAPGSPVYKMVSPRATQKQIEQKAEEMGLNKPLYTQYFLFMKKVFTGNLGTSIYLKKPILEILRNRIPNTLVLSISALLVSYVIAIPSGIIAATHKGGILDRLAMTGALVGLAMPQFWLGLLLMLAFSITFKWFPVGGIGGIRHLVLPAITLGAYGAGLNARMVRSNLLEVINKDYVRTARAKGLSEWPVITKHALRNALLPVISLLGLRIGWLVGGAVMVEVIFTRPGVGRLLVNSIYRRDYPVVQIVILIVVIGVIVGNIMADFLYGLADPRIRYE